MKKIIIILLLVVLSGCSNNTEDIAQNTVNIEVGKIGEQDTVTRAQVSKMLSLTKHSIADIEGLERGIGFEDCKAEVWYDKYVNACCSDGLMSGATENEFRPEEYLTLLQTQYLIEKLDSTKSLNIKYDSQNKDKPIAYSMWLDVFRKAVPNLESVGIKEVNIIIIADSKTCEALGERYVMTDKGLYSIEGFEVDKYINKEVKALVKDNEIVAITEFINNQPTILQAEVTKVGANGVRVKISGCERYYNYSGGKVEEGQKINIKISDNTIIDAGINYSSEVIT